VKGQSENNNLKKKFENFSYPVDESNWDAISSRTYAGSGNGFLGEKFLDYTSQPSPAVWRKVEAVIRPIHKRRPVAWWWYAAAASLLLGTYLGLTFFDPVDHKNQFTQENPPTKKQTGTNVTSEAGKNASTGAAQVASADSSGTPSPKWNKNTDAEKEKDLGTANKKEVYLSAENKEQLKSGSRVASVVDTDATFAERKGNDNTHEGMANTSINIRALARPLDKIALRIPEFQSHFTQGELAGEWKEVTFSKVTPEKKLKNSTEFYDGTETPASRNISLWAGSQLALASAMEENNSDESFSASSENGASLLDGDFNQSNNYSPPIYYGINGEIRLGKRISTGVGVGYLRMQSNSTFYFGNGNRVIEEIDNGYLSVPVYLKFNFVNKPKYEAYTSLGHSFDFVVRQKISSETYPNSQFSESNNLRNAQKGNQANVYMSLGMNFKLAKYLGIFAEGSAMHYYYMSNDNFYSQQSIWPGLKFGLLVSFE